MTPDEWRRARQILEHAVAQAPTDRRRAILSECGDNVALRQELEALLASYDEGTNLEAFLRLRQASPQNRSPEASLTTHTDLNRTLPDDGSVAARHSPVWGRYTLLEELGRGGFGVVYRAWDPNLRRDLALKLIDTNALRSGGEATWMREGQLLARVSHHNVVTVYGVERVGHEVGLAMEFINGRTLANLISQHGPLSAEEAIPIATALCDALAAVHHVGLVHRDLKASNVMRASGGRIVLMDFGAGRERVDSHHPTTTLLGTPTYMAPELLARSHATPGSDIYSLGVLLFYLVTGKYPVEGHTFADVQAAHKRDHRLSLAECRPDLPTPFVAIVERVLAPAPNERPSSAVTLRRDFEAVATRGESKRGRRSTQRGAKPAAVERPIEKITLQQVVVATTAVFLLVLGIGFIGALEFNHLLGRTGAFGREGVLSTAQLGARSLLGPLIYLGLFLLLFNILLLIIRIAGRLVPGFRPFVSALKQQGISLLTRCGLDDPNAVLRGLTLVSFLAFAATLWSFRDLLMAVARPIDVAPAEYISLLSRSNTETIFLYRRLLELNLILLATGAIGARRIGRQTTSPITPVAWIATGTVAALILLFLLGPWRVLYYPVFERAVYAGAPCFVIGRDDSRALSLLHCPALGPPRNRIVSNTDPGLRFTGTNEELFEAYSSEQAH